MIFQPIYKNITTFSGLTDRVSELESKGFSNEKFTPPYKANKGLSPKLACMSNSRIRSKFKGSCLKQEDRVHFTQSNVVDLFTLREWSKDVNAEFTLKDCLFGNLNQLEMLILTNILIQDTELVLIIVQFFQFQI